MPTDASNGNGRVTLAVLGTKLDNVIDNQKRLMEKQEKLEGAFNEHCRQASERDVQIRDNAEEIKELRKKSEGWNVLNTIGIFGAGLLAWFK